MRAEGERILIIEDDLTLAMGLELNLSAEGFEVLVAREGNAGLRLALEQQPALVVLDLMLPGIDGLALLARLRERGREMPVLILSARGEERDKLAGLGLGADDYVTKPFSVDELIARIHAHLRRQRQRQRATRRIRAGDLELDLEARQVLRGGTEIPLTAREQALLAYLARHPGRVHSRARLLTEVWGDDYEGTERTVDNFICSLRVKLEPDPASPRHIVTVRGAGYRFDP